MPGGDTRHVVLGVLVLASIGGALTAQPAVTGNSPARGAHSVPWHAGVRATFSALMASPSPADFRVAGSFVGPRTGAISGGGTTDLLFQPGEFFLPGERIEVHLTTGIQDTLGGALAVPYIWRFLARTEPGPADFTRTVALGTPALPGYPAMAPDADCFGATVGDVDGDGDLDIAAARFSAPNRLFRNDGNGNFTWEPIDLNPDLTNVLRFGDLDGDGDLDLAAGNWEAFGGYAPNQVFLNDGAGVFTPGALFGPGNDGTVGMELGDLDGDGDLDIAVGNGSFVAEPDAVYFNDGAGNFPTMAWIGDIGGGPGLVEVSWAIDLGDVDGDGDLDIVEGSLIDFSGVTECKVFRNDGSGGFPDALSIPIVSATQVMHVALGDIDSDGDLDLAIGCNPNYPGDLYTNDGAGNFTFHASFSAVADDTWGVDLVDIDGDGNLDLAIANQSTPTVVLLGDGAGGFPTSIPIAGLPAGPTLIQPVDADGDGDLDLFTSGSRVLPAADSITFNGDFAPDLAVTANGVPVPRGATLQVAGGSALATLVLQIAVADRDGDPVSVAGAISGIVSATLDPGEFSSASAPTPYDLLPVTGDFLDAPATHSVSLQADDGDGDISLFTFDIQVDAAFLCGDCNQDGLQTILDALLAAQVSASLVPSPLAGSAQFNACNPSGALHPDPGAIITILDALEMAQHAAGLIVVTCI